MGAASMGAAWVADDLAETWALGLRDASGAGADEGQAMTRVLVVAALLAAAHCQNPDPGPIPPTGGAGGTGGVAPATGGAQPSGGQGGTGGQQPIDDCEAAEMRLWELGCRTADGQPRWLTPAGTPLSVVCRARAADGDPICPKCLAAIMRCEEIELCRPHDTGECP